MKHTLDESCRRSSEPPSKHHKPEPSVLSHTPRGESSSNSEALMVLPPFHSVLQTIPSYVASPKSPASTTNLDVSRDPAMESTNNRTQRKPSLPQQVGPIHTLLTRRASYLPARDPVSHTYGNWGSERMHSPTSPLSGNHRGFEENAKDSPTSPFREGNQYRGSYSGYQPTGSTSSQNRRSRPCRSPTVPTNPTPNIITSPRFVLDGSESPRPSSPRPSVTSPRYLLESPKSPPPNATSPRYFLDSPRSPPSYSLPNPMAGGSGMSSSQMSSGSGAGPSPKGPPQAPENVTLPPIANEQAQQILWNIPSLTSSVPQATMRSHLTSPDSPHLASPASPHLASPAGPVPPARSVDQTVDMQQLLLELRMWIYATHPSAKEAVIDELLDRARPHIKTQDMTAFDDARVGIKKTIWVSLCSDVLDDDGTDLMLRHLSDLQTWLYARHVRDDPVSLYLDFALAAILAGDETMFDRYRAELKEKIYNA
ncbi:hypothetical protein K504DRAFT_506407 [Pleomassaria siparia CBS 279.74]|uniref:Uncharacterized protein n=1 Tax=Pleomassaria siparia CBS 279.74 TaxID=1314801 RepID=A0A6G1JX66_9PLEO|nr:hypothetical protein K504DRAFT_506407 [Pleomassaria siparia CBS 279.74]